MSEYQYYEFQAIDRPLKKADQAALRALSTRANITSTSFTNSYEWGDFKGDPVKLMERFFDVHLYLASWGTRQVMVRLPKALVPRDRLDRFLHGLDCATIHETGGHLILDISANYDEIDDDDDGSGWLGTLATLRADLLAGDCRMLCLVWLLAVQNKELPDEEPEPLLGTGPMTAALEAFANFFVLDPDLVAAAAERQVPAISGTALSTDAAKLISAMPDDEKTKLLLPQVSAERPRTAGELRARAEVIAEERNRAAAEEAAKERLIQAEKARKQQRARMDALERRGESAWMEVEMEIERRNASGYNTAMTLLSDLCAIAENRGTTMDFARRIAIIRERHARKAAFIARLQELH